MIFLQYEGANSWNHQKNLVFNKIRPSKYLSSNSIWFIKLRHQKRKGYLLPSVNEINVFLNNLLLIFMPPMSFQRTYYLFWKANSGISIKNSEFCWFNCFMKKLQNHCSFKNRKMFLVQIVVIRKYLAFNLINSAVRQQNSNTYQLLEVAGVWFLKGIEY